jgi:Uma2 family endonuclease
MHGIVEIKITTLLNTFVTQHKLGYVFGGETGLYTHRNPDTVRGVDAAYISHERFAHIKSASYLDVAPELVVEVMSPDDSWAEINDKIEEYFEIGVQLIWIVNPKRKRVHVYTTFTHLEIFNVGDTLTGGEILPQFELPVAAIFD